MIFASGVQHGEHIVATVAAGAGTAFAFWKTTGTGSGVATTGDLKTVTILSATAGDFTGAKLYPGGTSNVVLKLNNPNNTPVHVVSVVLNGTIPGQGACHTTGITFTPPPAGATIPTNTSTLVLAGAVTMA